MYTGHVAIALGARGVRRDVPLWILIVAAQACDWVEVAVHRMTPRDLPDVYSHALPFVAGPALAMAACIWLWKRSVGAAVAVLVVYLSHPVADLATGIKPLWLGGPNLGFGAIERAGADFAVQAAVCVLAFPFYWRSLPATRRRRIASAAPIVLLVFLQGYADFRLSRVRERRHRLRDAGPAIHAPIVEVRDLRT
jgi:hypothetical protein